jgi:hypothetical protein
MPPTPDLTRAADIAALRAALAAHADDLAQASAPHHTGALSSVRRAEHRGHAIEVRTTYAIAVDGRPFDVHLTVDNAGRVHYHGLPTRDFASVIDLVAKAIDAFPGDFAAGGGQEPGGHEPGGHGPGGHGH